MIRLSFISDLSTVGAHLVTIKSKVGIAVAVFAGLVFSILQLLPPVSDQEVLLHGTQGPNETDADEVTIVDEIEDGNEHSIPAGESRDLLAPRGFYIKGHVRDKDTKENVSAFDLEIKRVQDGKGKNEEWPAIVHETVKSDAGFFNFPLNGAGEYRVTVRSSCYKKQVMEDVKVSETNRVRELVFLLGSGYCLRGMVVDHATGYPVEDARVFPLNKKNDDSLLMFMLGFNEFRISDKTKERGEFLLKGLDNEPISVAAIHPQYVEAQAEGEPGTGNDLVFRLKKGPVIYGKAFDDRGNPVSKLLISVMGFQMPISRYVLTEDDGGFRTAPLLPGMILVRASSHPEIKKSEFTTETQVVVMEDRDEEVTFGPGPVKVTWSGCFYNGSKEPVAGGEVKLFPALVHSKVARYFNAGTNAVCDEQGRFEFKKLAMGVYRVNVSVPDQSFPIEWGEVTLDKPGLFEKDLHLSGGQIHGIIVDEISGQPLRGVKGVIYAGIPKEKNRDYAALVDETGAFHLYGLASGEYQLTPHIQGAPSQTYHGFDLGESEVLKNIELYVSYGGRLVISLCGFEALEHGEFTMSWRPYDEKDAGKDRGKGKEKGKGNRGWIKGSVDGDPAWETGRVLNPGVYTAVVEFINLGVIEKTFEIFLDQTTFLEIYRNELGAEITDAVDVTGTIKYEDGTVLAGAYVSVSTDDVQGSNSSAMDKTSEYGEFTLRRLRPGTWKMDVWIPASSSKTSISCPDLIILGGGVTPAPLDIIISIGIIKGEVFDAATGNPLGESVDSFRAVVMDVKTQKVVAQSYCGGGSGRFSFSGVEEGEYELVISANGYEEYRSDPFTLSEKQLLDLDHIHLDPQDEE